MTKSTKGRSRIALLALGAGLWGAGCGGNNVSVGQESAVFNLARCYETQCQASSPSIGVETGIRDCPEVVLGALAAEQEYAPPPDAPRIDKFSVGLDGSVWTLSGPSNSDQIVLSHYSPEGLYLGSTAPLSAGVDGWALTSLSVDSGGQVLVSLYASYAPTADYPVTELTVIHTFDSALKAVREPLYFRGSGESSLVGAGFDSFNIAGDADDYAPRGVLARVVAGDAEWVQTAVPSSGTHAGAGITALSVSPEGEASVLAQRSPRWEPGLPETRRFGVARFDALGALLWNLEMPTAYAGGYGMGMASTPAGDLVLRGVLPAEDVNQQRSLVRSVTRAGTLGWAFSLLGGFDQSLGVDSVGRTVVSLWNNVAVISADGQRCDQYELPFVAGALRLAAAVQVRGASLFVDGGGVVRRYRMPGN